MRRSTGKIGLGMAAVLCASALASTARAEDFLSALFGAFAAAGRLRQMVVLTKMLHETQRLVTGHGSFQSRRHWVSGARGISAGRRAVDRRLLIRIMTPVRSPARRLHFRLEDRVMRSGIRTANYSNYYCHNPPLMMQPWSD